MIRRSARILVLACALATMLAADGGALQLRQTAGPFVVSVFTAPATLRAGNVDFSVLVQDAGQLEPVLDADVEVRARAIDGIVVSKVAYHDNAQNKLLYAASLNLPQPGEWAFTVLVRQRQSAAQVSGKLEAGPGEPRFLAHWPQWAFVPVFLLFFVLHQYLKRQQEARVGSPRSPHASNPAEG